MSAKPRYFEDENGEYRYAVDGSNGENMATSEGYSGGETAARRGLKDLRDALIEMDLDDKDDI